MYVPKPLQPNFVISSEKSQPNILVSGHIECCNQSGFEILYHGESKNSWIGHVVLNPVDDTVAVWARCPICGKLIPIFNSLTNGYDRCVEGENEKKTLHKEQFRCIKCQREIFQVAITFEYPQKEELLSDGISDYENGFSWIWVSLTCASCNRKYRNIIDLETA
ncbi:MAG TPA: hypothetical protein PKA81_07635 [Clostridia bacterium]|nr:hypothetical protein [Clostridia bacterium]